MDIEQDEIKKMERLLKLPKWAQAEIARLHTQIRELEFDKKRLEEMIPYSKPDMSWEVLNNDSKDRFSLFRLCENRALNILSIGPGDRLFIGRAKR